MRSRTGSTIRLLLIERDPGQLTEIETTLRDCLGENALLASATGGRDAVILLRASTFDIVLVDLKTIHDLAETPEKAVAYLSTMTRGGLVIAMSDGNTVSSSVSAMRAGAHDHMTKPICGETFVSRLDTLARCHRKAGIICGEAQWPDARETDTHFLAASSQMRLVLEHITRIAGSSAPVFITGERGTGKKLCAEMVHTSSKRAEMPFVTIDCRATTNKGLERALFGSAETSDISALQRANGGTLVIDDISAMTLDLQAKLLGFLQTGTLTHAGAMGAVTQTLDVRLICTTPHAPKQLIAAETLRDDLFYRLNVLPVHVPPLRHRPADILPLATRFLADFAGAKQKSFSGIGSDAADMLIARDWPGNVRQLSDVMHSIAHLFDGGTVTPAMINAAEDAICDKGATRADNRPMVARILPMWQQEQKIIEDTIALFDGNISKAAAALEISPSTIYRKRQSWAEMSAPIVSVA